MPDPTPQAPTPGQATPTAVDIPALIKDHVRLGAENHDLRLRADGAIIERDKARVSAGELAAEVAGLREQLATVDTEATTWHDEFVDAVAERDKAYRERAALVAYLAAVYPSVVLTDSAEPDWPIVLVSTPAGQMSWHVAKADLELFPHVQPTFGPTWDGHTTEEKYARLAELTATVATGLSVHAERDRYREALKLIADPESRREGDPTDEQVAREALEAGHA